MANDELKHHGVKGMRWGVRKDKRSRTRIDKDYLIKKGQFFVYEYADDAISAILQTAAIALGVGFITPLIAYGVNIADSNIKIHIKR